MSNSMPSPEEIRIAKRLARIDRRKDIIKRISTAYKLSKSTINQIIDDYEQMMAELLMQRGHIAIKHLGIIRIIDKKRNYHNVNLRCTYYMESKKIVFIPYAYWKERLKKFRKIVLPEGVSYEHQPETKKQKAFPKAAKTAG